MARVKYAYRVNDKDYSSQRIAWGGGSVSSLRSEAEKILAQYPVGSTVRVHYNPQKLSEAVLDPSSTGGLSVMWWMAVVMAVIGVFVVVLGVLAALGLMH
jgi:hypothetical protein